MNTATAMEFYMDMIMLYMMMDEKAFEKEVKRMTLVELKECRPFLREKCDVIQQELQEAVQNQSTEINLELKIPGLLNEQSLVVVRHNLIYHEIVNREKSHDIYSYILCYNSSDNDN